MDRSTRSGIPATTPALSEPSTPVSDLLNILDLEKLEENLFRGVSPNVGWNRVFGGLVISQALVAAARTVADDGESPRFVHSLHAYFLLGGDPQSPIVYEVDRIRDGRSFTTRRIKAIQHGEAIFAMSASFHVREEGFAHQLDMPEVPAPDELPGEAEFLARLGDAAPEPIRRYFSRAKAIELRPVDLTRYTSREKRAPAQRIWIRASSPLPDDPRVHEAVLAYASDMTLLDTSLVPHALTVFDPDIMPASLDHALWFHAPFRADDWLLYAQDSPAASGARGLTRGLIYARDGRLVASVAQEGLIRRRSR